MRVLATALLGLAMLACAVGAAADTESPTISSVVLSPSIVPPGGLVHVTVTATDDTGVAWVTANGAQLEVSGGGGWEGDIVGAGAPGEHAVLVTAADASGNEASDNTHSYETRRALGIGSADVLDPTAGLAADAYLFRVWGNATILNPNSFSLDDGGGFPVTVIAPGHTICTGDYASAWGFLDNDAFPATISGGDYSILLPTPDRIPINIPDVTIGKDLQVSLSGHLQNAAPAGNLVVTLESQDPSKVLLASGPAEPGKPIITRTVAAGSTTIGAFYVQALGGSGGAGILATAPGCQARLITVSFAPSGFIINSPSSITTTTFADNSSIEVRSARLQPDTLAWAASQQVRPGVTADVPVTISDANVGQITLSPVTFAGGDVGKTTQFDPINSGSATISIQQPAGWSTPFNYQSIAVSVSAPIIIAANARVGENLQTAYNVTLQSSPPSPVDIVVTSNDPGVVLLSKTANAAGSSSVTLEDVSGTSVQTIYLHGISEGASSIAVTADGYSGASPTISVDPSGFIINSPSVINTTAFSDNTNIQITSARLTPDSLSWAANEAVRPGVSANVAISSSVTDVGTITVSPLVFVGNQGSLPTQFDPVGGGTTTIAISQPPGWDVPSNYQQITANVTAPAINVGVQPVGEDLLYETAVSLGVTPPGPVDITVSSDNPSIFTISTSATTEGSAAVVLEDVANTTGRTIYIEGRSIGSANLSVSAPGYTPKVQSVRVDPSGFIINAPSLINTTRYSDNFNVHIRPARLSPDTLAWQSSQPLRGGLTVDVSVGSSNPAAGTISPGSVQFTGGVLDRVVVFDPLEAGTSTIFLTPPAGFHTPSNYQQITATVTVANVVMSGLSLGRHLQEAANVTLQSAPPAPVDVTVVSPDPTAVLLSTSRTSAGSSSVTFPAVAGTYAGQVYVQALKQGVYTLQATASGYTDAQPQVTVDPSGFIINNPSVINTTAGAANTLVYITPARLHPVTLNWASNGEIRGGFSVSVDVSSSNPGAGGITLSPLSFVGGDRQQITQFDPAGTGVSTISVGVPLNFSQPSNYQSITANVNP